MVEASIYIPVAILMLMLLVFFGLFFLHSHLVTTAMLKSAGEGTVNAYGYRDGGIGRNYANGKSYGNQFDDIAFGGRRGEWDESYYLLDSNDQSTKEMDSREEGGWVINCNEADIRLLFQIHGRSELRLRIGTASSVLVNPVNFSRSLDASRYYTKRAGGRSYYDAISRVNRILDRERGN